MKNANPKKAYEAAYERTESLDNLISPSDIDEEADGWADISDMTLEDEVHESLNHINWRKAYGSIIHELKMNLFLDDMPRIPLEDLAFDSEKEAAKNGYWTCKVDYDTMREWVEEFDGSRVTDVIHHEYWREAYETVSAGVADALNPRKGKTY